MFLKLYQLPDDVFGVTPDPGHLYLGSSHREALASLLYGLKCGRGFMALVAKPGMGKTSMLFYLLDQLQGSARTALIFQTQCNPTELLRLLLTDLGVKHVSRDRISMHYQLNDLLMEEAARGRQVVVMIDEAQNLSEETLESVRLLSNFEKPTGKLIQIILAGQPALADKLARPGLVQLRQRVAIMTHLEPFTRQDTELFIRHRLNVSGYSGGELFDSNAVGLIADLSDGVPRKINALCFNALSIGCALHKEKIDEAIVREAAADTDISSLRCESRPVEYREAPPVPIPGRSSPFARESSEANTGEAGQVKGIRKVRLERWAIGGATACGCLIAAFYLAPGRMVGRELLSLWSGTRSESAAIAAGAPTAVQKSALQERKRKIVAPSAIAVNGKLVAPKFPTNVVHPILSATRRQSDPRLRRREKSPQRSPASASYLETILERQAWVLQRTRPESMAKVIPFRQGQPSQSVGSSELGKPASSEPETIPMQVASAVQEERLISMVKPKYPPLAAANGIEGSVVLQIIISRDGTVELAQYVSGPSILASAAMDAVEQWRYRPAYQDGKPVKVETTVRVPFGVAGKRE